ncbi:disease 7 homolog [Octopus vulgaris]|uniref:Disease 7 homolog n=2 Tax=Octopus TaxID=6643 RepID=A0AA36FJE2_OCTVU|nr:Parkinson disease protein 7 homolog [Octopus sinensis]CAI9741246.1 disease 7 homolog [Octopus vulgaris]
MPSALVILAEGAEEMEAVITIDVLRRGGVCVTVGGLSDSNPVKCSRDTVIVPDKSLQQAISDNKYDAVIIPGGLQGSKLISESSIVKNLLQEQEKRTGLIAAICAGPTALMAHKICMGKRLTSYPAFKDKLTAAGYNYSEDRVVVDGRLITSRGPGTAFEFALAIVKALDSQEKADSLVAPMLLKL